MRSLRVLLITMIVLYILFFVNFTFQNRRERVKVPERVYSYLIENFNISPKSIIIDSKRIIGIVFYEGNYYLCAEDGSLVASLSGNDLFKFYPMFLEVKLEGLRLSKKDREVLEMLIPILKSSMVSAVLFESKEIVLLKGTVIVFEGWKDLVENFQVIMEQSEKMKAKEKYFLTDDGRLMWIRGD